MGQGESLGRLLPLLLRAGFGGVLMGLANLVPGISGGTMLLAAGVYPRFIDGVAELTTFRFRRDSILVIGTIALAAMLGIVLLAGTVKDLVVTQRWIMYSLFIGLTLGGVPIVWRLARPIRPWVWVGAAAGLAVMIGLVVLQQSGAGGSGGNRSSMPMLFLAGVAGASAMILPGVSGGYLLLVLGQYVPILASIDRTKTALGDRDFGAMLGEWRVIIPVGVGVVVGVVVVSNVARFMLHRFEKPTLGVLLGLLVGAVIGLWPFQQGVEPEIGSVIKGQTVTEASLATIDAEDWPVAFFAPNASQVGFRALLILAGLGVTLGISSLSPPTKNGDGDPANALSDDASE